MLLLRIIISNYFGELEIKSLNLTLGNVPLNNNSFIPDGVSVIRDDNSFNSWLSTFLFYMIALCHETGKSGKLSPWETCYMQIVFYLTSKALY